MKKFEDVFLICLLHSKEGGPIKAVLTPIQGQRAVVARCPVCIDLGQSILRKAKLDAEKTARAKLEEAGHVFAGEPLTCSKCHAMAGLLQAGSIRLGRSIVCGEAEEKPVEVPVDARSE
jgi:hypothetical protein